MPPLTELYSNVGIAADPTLAAGISTSATTITFSSTSVVSHFPTAVAGVSQFRALIYEDTNADGQADKAELVTVISGGAGSISWTLGARAVEAIGGQQTAFAFSTAARVAPILSSGGMGNLPGVSGDFALAAGRHLKQPSAYYPTAPTGGAGSDWTLYSSGVDDPTRQADMFGVRAAVLRFAFTENTRHNQAGILIDHVYQWMYCSTFPVTATGSGYATPPVVTISAPTSGGVQAYAVALLAGGIVNGITPATGASATATVDQDGVITALSGLVGGANFPLSATGLVVVLEQSDNRIGRATVNTNSSGVATSITLTSGGRGYTAGSVNISTAGLYDATPTVTSITGGGGSGATAIVTMGTIIRTGVHIKSFVPVDNGGESSALLVTSYGGSNAFTAYRAAQYRPSGFANYHDTTQPASETSTDSASAAGFFGSGFGAGSKETATTTDNPTTAGATTINVNSTTGFLVGSSGLGYGVFEDTNEAFSFTGLTSTAFTGVTRGINSTAASHALGTTVRQKWPAAAVWGRVEYPISKGMLVMPGDGLFNKRPAYSVALHYHGRHTHSGAVWEVLMDGSQTGRNGYFTGSNQATPYDGMTSDRGGQIIVNDTNGGVGNGGKVEFSCSAIPFAAIKGYLTDGAGMGHLVFGIRSATGSTWAYSEAMRIVGPKAYVGIQATPATNLFEIGGNISGGDAAFGMSSVVTNGTAIFFTPQLNMSSGGFAILSAQARVVPTATISSPNYGFLSIPTIGPSTGANNSNTFGFNRIVNIYSATTTAPTYGGTITEVMDYHAGGMSLGTGSTATATKQYGFYCALLPTKNLVGGSSGPAEQSWAVYAEGRAATPAAGDRGNPSYFGDFVRVWDVEQFGTFVRYGVQVNRNAATLSTVNLGALTATVTSGTAATFVSTVNGGVLNIATTAVANVIASVVLSSFSQTQFQWGPVFTCNLQPVDITAVRIWAGLFQSAMTNADTPASGNACAAFRFSTVAGDTTWRFVTANATTATVATSVNSITVAANTRYLVRVDCSDTVNARGYINGLLVASTNVTIPPASTFLGMEVAVITQTTVIKNLRFGGMWIAEE